MRNFIFLALIFTLSFAAQASSADCLKVVSKYSTPGFNEELACSGIVTKNSLNCVKIVAKSATPTYMEIAACSDLASKTALGCVQMISDNGSVPTANEIINCARSYN